MREREERERKSTRGRLQTRVSERVYVLNSILVVCYIFDVHRHTNACTRTRARVHTHTHIRTHTHTHTHTHADTHTHAHNIAHAQAQSDNRLCVQLGDTRKQLLHLQQQLQHKQQLQQETSKRPAGVSVDHPESETPLDSPIQVSLPLFRFRQFSVPGGLRESP